jgi:membrane protease subunit (stomatin/prohibitin family)
MGILDYVKSSVRELAIARPDANKGAIVYKHPDPTIPTKAQLTVGTDEEALFFKDGAFVGKIGPGRHTLETSNWPFLSNLIDKFTGGNVFKAEVWYITTREVAGFKFGGRIGDVEDPKSGLAIGTMVHGEYSIQVTDSTQVIQFFGQRSWAGEEEFTGWFRQQLLKTIRDRIASLLVVKKLPLLDVTSGALTEEIETEVIEAVNASHLKNYGMRVVRLGNFVVSIKEEDEATLKNLYKDQAQLRMAGNNAANLAAFQQLAAGKAMMGAGEGMAIRSFATMSGAARSRNASMMPADGSRTGRRTAMTTIRRGTGSPRRFSGGRCVIKKFGSNNPMSASAGSPTTKASVPPRQDRACPREGITVVRAYCICASAFDCARRGVRRRKLCSIRRSGKRC